MTIQADARWNRVRVASDLHLHKDEPLTAARWHQMLADDDADAWFLLGDYFEVWVGDDLLDASDTAGDDGESIAFWQHCVKQLEQLTRRKPVFWLAGNRDFLVGERFARMSGVQLLDDPVIFEWGASRRLLSHGDHWCTSDADYMAFRAQVRTQSWQAAFLAQDLSSRLAQAKAMRAQSRAHQQQRQDWTDVTEAAVLQDVARLGATEVIHGHTHEGVSHALGPLHRHVLGDGAIQASPPRWSVLELTPTDTHWLSRLP